MAGFVSKQPNGLYCRFSTVVDCPTDWNMTAEDYIELCKQKAEREAKEVLENYLQPFEMVKERFYPNNMSQKEFEEFLKEVENDQRQMDKYPLHRKRATGYNGTGKGTRYGGSIIHPLPRSKGKEGEGEQMKFYWFEFEDGYRCCVAGMSNQELRVEESKHGKLLRKEA